MTTRFILSTLETLFNRPKLTRKFLLPKIDKYIYQQFVENDKKQRPEAVQQYKYKMMRGMLDTVLRNLERGYITPKVMSRVIDTFVQNALHHQTRETMEAFKKEHGTLTDTLFSDFAKRPAMAI